MFNVQSRFLFGNVWGFHGVGHAYQFPFLLFPFSGVLCSIDSGCDSVTDTETEDEKVLPYLKKQSQPLLPPETSPENLMVVQPERIRCGVGTSGAGGSMSAHRLSGFSVDGFVGVKGTGSLVALQCNAKLPVGFPLNISCPGNPSTWVLDKER